MDTLLNTLFENWPDTWDLGMLLSNETDLCCFKAPRFRIHFSKHI